jgi:osmotically inducible protein OsmC
MPIRTAEAEWKGNLRQGNGTMKLGSGAYEGAFSFGTRFEENPGSNPEELVGAAFAGCFSMALSADIERAGFQPTRAHTSARVHLERGESGFSITRIELNTEAEVPGLDDAKFQEIAEGTRKNCPIAKSLAVPDVQLTAKLV